MLEKKKIQKYIDRLLLSRIRILDDYGFYGLLLMHIIFSVDESCKTAATDGVRIYFSPRFLDALSDSELDFVMMHEILHVVLLHVLRGTELDSERFNIACDIVVNSNIMLERGMAQPIQLHTFGEAMHLTPNGKEGHLYTAEQVYEMLRPNKKGGNGFADDHTRWGMAAVEGAVLQDVWRKHMTDAAQAIAIRNNSTNRGVLPAFAKRIIDQWKKPQTDWRTILNDFVQEEINDYSLYPPDKRFAESPFFLPDFNEKDEWVKNILFMIDTSGSMSDGAIAAAFSEIAGAVAQFGGKLVGKLGFFDAAIIEAIPFEDVDELKKIKPIGGGGTDFRIIFDYVARDMEDEPPASIIILTDGHAPFPKERYTNGIPVLWLLNNEDVEPPWGKVARITIEERLI